MDVDNNIETAALVPLPRSSDFDVDPASFSAASWLNQVISSSATVPSLSSLSDTLSDALRESHEALDGALKDALRVVPWVVRESERVRQRTNALRSDVDAVGERVVNVETGVASSVKTIADADTVVRRVQNAVALLETAASADILLERLESLLASAGADGSDLVAAADVAAQLRKALLPLRNVKEVADRFEQLDHADARLETLAAPQLRKALDARNSQAAVNARIVFDHAGRENAFRVQYVSLRGAQVRQLWTDAWSIVETRLEHDNDVSTEDTSSNATSSPMHGELTGDGANTALINFYDRLASLVSKEADWLEEAFPDLKATLLPALLCDSLSSLSDPKPRVNIFLHPSTPNPVAVIDIIADRLFDVAQTAVAAAARIAITLLPGQEQSSPVVHSEITPTISRRESNIQDGKDCHKGVDGAIIDAITALLFPHHEFWNALMQIAIRQARTRAEMIKIASTSVSVNTEDGSTAAKMRPPLSDIARDVEVCAKDACTALDAVVNTISSRSSGIAVSAMKQATETICSIVSERLLKIVRLPPSSLVEDEWTRLGGSLRLLIAMSSFKRVWNARKEAAFAIAVGSATPVLELASAVRDDFDKRTKQFLLHVDAGAQVDAAVVWELVRDERLSQRVVTEFESLDSTDDFRSLIESVHRIVYDTMFDGISSRFSSFSAQDLWSTDKLDSDAAMAGLSSSPLRYATEVADYLMAIPQQLEPFVPDDEEARFATPSSVFAFSKLRNARERELTPTSAVADSGHEDLGNISFAGMWISVLAIGTMDMYVEKICSLSRLSEEGARQLTADTDYLCNVMASLGVAPTSEMELMCKLLESKRDPVSFLGAAEGYESAEHRKLIRRVAAVRGISVSL